LVGTKTILDVLTAQSALYLAQSNHSKNQYAYLLNTLKLKQAAGTLCVQDLVKLNKWLTRHVSFKESYLVNHTNNTP
jgi:outer membrane protein